MQDLAAERKFYSELFGRNPENEHISSGYDELHQIAMPTVPNGPVFDIGCGTGGHTVRLARKGCDVVAMDLTIEGVRGARARLAKEGLKARFLVGDAENLPFRDKSAAVAWTFLLLHHFPKLDKLPRELSRVARDKIIALEPNAKNAVTWVFNNIVNKFMGTERMSVNQRAMWPGSIEGTFAPVGFVPTKLIYVDRRWNDDLGWVRKTYDLATKWMPESFRANKFLVILERRSA
jgi:SAM-dependent methyltransferase